MAAVEATDRSVSLLTGQLSVALMMTQFMASMAWQNTGGKVMDAADQYGTSQDYMSGAVSFGNGGISGGAPAYAARSALAAERTGAIAYEQFGSIGEIGRAITGGPAAPFLNDAGVSAGLGLTAGVGAWAAGGAAGPVGWGVGLTAAGYHWRNVSFEFPVRQRRFLWFVHP